VNLGTHWVDGAGLADLGTVQLPRPGRVRIEAATDPDVLEFVARRDELDVRADEVVPWTRDLLLPPGRWVALWRRGTELGVREFTLAGDASVALDR